MHLELEVDRQDIQCQQCEAGKWSPGVGPIRYGNDALPYLKGHKLEATVVIVVFVLLSYLVSRVLLRHKPEQSA